jgi:hypothetical protein
VLSKRDLRMLARRFIVKTLGFCPAGLAEIPKRIDQSATALGNLFGARYARMACRHPSGPWGRPRPAAKNSTVSSATMRSNRKPRQSGASNRIW